MADAPKPIMGQSSSSPAVTPPHAPPAEPDRPQSTYEVVGKGRVIMTSVGRYVEGEVCLLDDVEADAFGTQYLKKVGDAKSYERLRTEHHARKE